MKRLVHKVALTHLAIIAGLAAGSVYVGVMAVYGWARGTIIEHIAATEIQPSSVPRGATFTVNISYRKRSDCPGTWAYYLRYGISPEWQLIRSGPTGANAVGAYSFRHLMLIPSDAPVGPAQWREVINAECNPWWATVSRSLDRDFTITE